MNPTGSAIPAATGAPAPAGNPSEFGDYSDWAQGELAKGFTADQLHQSLQQSGVQLPQAAPAPTAAPQGGGGSWWQKLIPAAGGVLGGLVGTLAGPVGSVGGATGGAALGQMLENKLEGKAVLQGNDISSGVENGVGELVGLGAGKLVGKLGEGLVHAGANAGEKTAQDALATSATKGLVRDAEATKLNYGGISPKLSDELELGKSQQFVKGMGMDHTNPYDMEKVGSAVEPLNNVYDRALTSSPKVSTADLSELGAGVPTNGLSTAEAAQLQKQGFTPDLITKMTGGNGAVGNTAVDPNSPIGQAVADFTKSSGIDLSKGLPPEMDATDVRKLQQAIGRQIGNTHTIINNAELNGTYNVEAQNSLRGLQDLYGKLGDKIKTPEVNKAIEGYQVTDADRQGLIATHGEKLGNHIADTIGNAKSADDLLGPMQDFTKMGRASRLAINDIENVTNSPRALARAKFEANGGVSPSKSSMERGGSAVGDMIEAGAKAIHSPTGLVVAAGRKMHEAGLTPKIAKGLGNVIKRTAPLMAPAAVVNSNIPNIAAGMQGGGSVIPSNQGGGDMQPAAPGAAPAATGNPVNSALSSILWSLQQPGASLLPGYSSMVGGAQALAPAGQQNELAAGTAGALAPTFANAGGAQGMGGGLVSSLLSHVPGTAQNTYTREQTAAADQIAKILGISPQAALAMLPQFMQTPGTAAPQQAATNGLVGNLTAGLPAAQ